MYCIVKRVFICIWVFLLVISIIRDINFVGILFVFFICKWFFLVFYYFLYLCVIENGIEMRLVLVN